MSRACLWKTHRATTPDRAEIGRICGVSFPLQASGSADSVQREGNAVFLPCYALRQCGDCSLPLRSYSSQGRCAPWNASPYATSFS